MSDEKIVNSVVELSVDPNSTTAFLTFTKPENGGIDMTFEKVMAALSEKNISFGIMEDALREAVEKSATARTSALPAGSLPLTARTAPLHTFSRRAA